jgi:beta-galactosidase/evolved beta-galactosidase subunit alpha
VRIRIHTRVAPPIHDWGLVTRQLYTVSEDGVVLLEVEVDLEGRLESTLPRLGLECTLPGSLEQVSWYGRGPGESYTDTKLASRIGRWRATVDELFTNYVMPQENGNRTDVRWVRFTNPQGVGFEAVGDPLTNFSAHRFTTEDLDRARHTIDLVPRETITVHLDHAHNGIGTNSCGPGPLPQYELRPGSHAWSLRLVPVV